MSNSTTPNPHVPAPPATQSTDTTAHLAPFSVADPSAGSPSARAPGGLPIAAEIDRPWFKLLSILGALGLTVGTAVAGLAVWQTSDRSAFLVEQKATAEAARDAARVQVKGLEAEVLRLTQALEQVSLRGCRVLVSNTAETELDGPATIQSIQPTEGGSPLVVFSQGPSGQTANVPVNVAMLKFPLELPVGASIRSHGPTSLFVQGTCRSK